MDRNLLKKALFDYRLKTEIYNNSYSLVKAYRQNDFKVRSLGFIDYSDRLKDKSTSRGTFKEAAEEYHTIKTSLRFGNKDERLTILEVRYAYLKDAYNILGIERIRTLEYNPTLIRREIEKNSDKPVIKKIINLAVGKIGYHNPMPLNDAKGHLQDAYNILGLGITATASKLKKYFTVKET